MEVIKAIISDNIYIEYDVLSRELRRNIEQKYLFQIRGFQNSKETLRLFNRIVTEDGEKWLLLPPNPSYFDEVMYELGYKVEYIDKRVAPKCEQKLETNIVPRENQIPILKGLEKFGYNSLLTAKTGAGKTFLSIYLTQKLQTNMLFVASRTSLLKNLIKDCEKAGVDSLLITEINTKWLDNPVITPIMYCTTSALNEQILDKLYNNVGFLVADEVHLGISAEGTRKKLFSINPKYRLYMSATPENKFKGSIFACLSNNEVTAEENIDYTIQVHNLEVKLGYDIVEEYYGTDSYHEKKDILFGNVEYLENMSRMVAYLIKKRGRGVLVYLEDKEGQEKIAEYLRLYGLNVGVLNSNTKKKQQQDIIQNYDNGKYDVIVGGTSTSAGLSFERLSVVVDVNITLNSNNLQQLLGRLKRRNVEICDKSKEFIKVTVAKITDRKWTRDKKALTEFDYIHFTEKVSVNLVDSDSKTIINALNELEFY